MLVAMPYTVNGRPGDCPAPPRQAPSAAQTPAELWSFPDRTTAVGGMIDAYLSSKTDLDDAAIHLLFSANRWEKQ